MVSRRIIYLILTLVILIPLLRPFKLKPLPMKPVENLFYYINNMPKDKALLISVDYSPDTEAELHPMTIALLKHAFYKRIKVGVLTLTLLGLGLAEDALRTVVKEFNERAKTREDSIIYGRDYVFLGWQTPPLVPLLGMGESITKVFPVDYYGNRTDTLPLLQQIKNYRDVGIVVSISGSAIPMWYVTYAQTTFGVKVGAGFTAVSAADYYPYLNSGQLTGLLAGMRGGAEYEELVEKHFGKTKRRKATEAMSSQTTAHIMIIILIIIGNIIYFKQRRRK
ncbi:MAG: hypothetical protein N2323_03325 [candidate division WOR-3 bacterium]|nr:hypothetical protein [candidate division WOR-3 bacterium]MCX7836973.1 hypothetical protein [candidate division WOR-3 bacterium]MDW8114101.1 hypothetical protein [candidate division WOR-3 bacterium]